MKAAGKRLTALILMQFYGVVRVTITAAETEQYQKTEKTVTITVPSPAEIEKVSVKKKQVLVVWKKSKYARGYQLQYSKTMNFKMQRP